MSAHIRIGGKRINITPGTKIDDAEFLRELERIADDPRWHGDGEPEPDPQNGTG